MSLKLISYMKEGATKNTFPQELSKYKILSSFLMSRINPGSVLLADSRYSTINVVWPTLKQLITRSKMSKFYSNIKLGVPDDQQNCRLLLFLGRGATSIHRSVIPAGCPRSMKSVDVK